MACLQPRSHLLFEDEQFKLPDSRARHMFYKPLPQDGSPIFTASKEPSSIICLNLTKTHFKPGATKFRDLKPAVFDLLSIFFNSLSFAFDKKKRLTTTQRERKNNMVRAQQRKHQQTGNRANLTDITNEGNADGENGMLDSDDANVQSDEVQVEKESDYINGAKSMTIYVETLMENSGTAFKVGGYRLWIFDASVDKSGFDLLTKGLKESLIEAVHIQNDVREKLNEFEQRAANGPKNTKRSVMELKKNYSYTKISTEDLFIDSVSEYFSRDGLMMKNASHIEQEEAEAEENDFSMESENDSVEEGMAVEEEDKTRERLFIDNRAFLAHNRNSKKNVDYRPRITERVNTMRTFFGKESAMVYHVENDNIRTNQCTLSTYFGTDSDQINNDIESRKLGTKNRMRLHDMIEDAIPDKDFRQFPYPKATYRIDERWFSQDILYEMVLPHHLGTHLYTTLDQQIVTSRIAKKNSGGKPKPKKNNKKTRVPPPSAVNPKKNSSSNTPTPTIKKAKKPIKKKKDLFGYHTRKETEEDQEILRLNNLLVNDADENNPDPMELEDGEVMPLGIFDSEYEINTSLMSLHPHYLTDNMKEILKKHSFGQKTATVPQHVRGTFLSLIDNDIRKGLTVIANNVDKSKNYVVDQAKNNNLALEYLPYLEVEQKDKSDILPFRATSVPYILDNRDKRHIIDRKVYSVIGGDNNAVSREKNKNLSCGNIAYFRGIIAQWRAVDATVENALQCMATATYDRVFLERDIYLILDVLNRHGYAQIDKHFFDNRTNKIRSGQTANYIRTRRAFTEAITVEFYEEFFTSSRVSMPNIGIRNDLFGIRNGVVDTTKQHIGIRMPVSKFNTQTRPFYAYSLWVYSYFVEHDGINHNYKTSDILFHARYHHCRSYPPSCKDPKMNVIMSGVGTAGKSHKLGATKDACPSGVAEGLTHVTGQAYNTNQNMNDMLIINEEMSNKLIAPSQSKKGSGNSEAANDDTRNNFKERSTSQMTVTLSFYVDEETGERKARLSKCQCQNVLLGATNNDLTDADPNVMSRFIVISVPRSKNDVIGNRPQDKNKLEMGKDEVKNTYLQEQVREVHRIYYMIECLIKSGVLGNTTFGVTIDGAVIYMTRILDLMQAKYGIATNDVRKRKHIIEMARCMCISFAVWYGLTSPLTRYLQHDVYTGEFIGFNPRVLLDGIIPYLVVTKDMVIRSISCLSCLFVHEYMEKILEKFATELCHLDELRESDFVYRPKSDLVGPGSNTTATSALTTKFDKSKNGGKRTGGLGSAPSVNDVEMAYDYNYISLSARAHGDIHNLIADKMGTLQIATNDISKVLHDQSRLFIHTDGYVMKEEEVEEEVEIREVIDNVPVLRQEVVKKKVKHLVKSTNPDNAIPRKIVDYGFNASTGQPTIAVSVAFLRQKLPHKLKESLIEDLTEYKYTAREITEEERQQEQKEIASNVQEEDEMMILKENDVEMLDTQAKTLIEKLSDVIVIKPGGSNEVSYIKAIREVLENNILERTQKDSDEQDRIDAECYADVNTGLVPWYTFGTAEHPKPLIINDIFPDLAEAYNKIPGHNKEIILSDKQCVINLLRKKNGEELVYYNYNTVAPSSKASLSIFSATEPEYKTVGDDEDEIYRTLEGEELAAIRNEMAKFDTVTKNRFKIFSETPVFRIKRDLDYIMCTSHLRDIGYPIESENSRIVNYPPHIYMNIADYRDRCKNPEPLEPLCGDALDRIATTKKIMEANLGIFAEDTPELDDLIDANYEADDLMDTEFSNPMLNMERRKRLRELKKLEVTKKKKEKDLKRKAREFDNDDDDEPETIEEEEEEEEEASKYKVREEDKLVITRRQFSFREAEKTRAKEQMRATLARYGLGQLGLIDASPIQQSKKMRVK